jgi:hypothetical protein
MLRVRIKPMYICRYIRRLPTRNSTKLNLELYDERSNCQAGGMGYGELWLFILQIFHTEATRRTYENNQEHYSESKTGN